MISKNEQFYKEGIVEIDFIDEDEVMKEVYKRVKGRLKEKLIANK